MVLRSYVGAPVKRKEDPRLITGSSVYVDDLQLAGMAHIVIVRSPYAHANIKGIDATEARAMPGVVTVIMAKDLAKVLADKYPVEAYPSKIVSFNLDKDPVVEGTLLGIKGQYLIFDTGVINIRKYTAYQLAVLQ